MESKTDTAPGSDQRLSLQALIALVVGSMIGSGIFVLPAAFGRATGALGALIAWCIAGAGMLMLAFVFQTLSRRRPDLNAGIYAYAKAGFGEYPGFISAVGYWIGCCLADVACLVLIKATLGLFFPVFGDGTTFTAIVAASALLWGVHLLVLRGVKQAAAFNTVATYAKVVPILTFIVAIGLAFRTDIFTENLWGGAAPTFSNVAGQARDTMLVTVFVFVGIEGASVYSRYATDRNDVGVATVLGFLCVLSLLILVTMLSYGIMLRPELGALPSPSMAGVMEAVVGPWGKIFISIGLLISILGNYLSFSLLAAEIMHSAAANKTMPAFLAGENANKAPAAALWLTNAVIQFFLIVTWFAEYAFTMALKMTSAMTLIPYFLIAAFGLKLAWSGKTYAGATRERRVDLTRGGIASLYTAGMIYAGGLKFVLLAAVLYAPATALFAIARREQQDRIFTLTEWLLFALILGAAVAGIAGLTSGAISL